MEHLSHIIKGKKAPQFTQTEIELYKRTFCKIHLSTQKVEKICKEIYKTSRREQFVLIGRCSVKRLIEWVCCPMYGSKTRIKIRSDTELTNFPLYCPKYKREALFKAKDLHDEVSPDECL